MKTSTVLKLSAVLITVTALFSNNIFEVFGYALLIAITGCSGLICQALEDNRQPSQPPTPAKDYIKQNYDAKG